MNDLEREVLKKYRAEGFYVLRSGWPDFLLVRGTQVAAIEVKSSIDKFSVRQQTMFRALSRSGMLILEAREGSNQFDASSDGFTVCPYTETCDPEIYNRFHKFFRGCR